MEATEINQEFIERIVCQTMDITSRELREPRKSGRKAKERIAVPRQTIYFFTRKYTAMSYAKMARPYGQDHTTAMHGCRMIQNILDTKDKKYGDQIINIKESIQGKMKKQISITGRITEKGIQIGDQAKHDEFIRHNKGRQVMITLELMSREPSRAMVGFFRKVIVPEFQSALYEAGERYTLEATEQKILGFTPVGIHERLNEITGKYEKHVKALEQLSHDELHQAIAHLKQIAAENFGRDIK